MSVYEKTQAAARLTDVPLSILGLPVRAETWHQMSLALPHLIEDEMTRKILIPLYSSFADYQILSMVHLPAIKEAL